MSHNGVNLNSAKTRWEGRASFKVVEFSAGEKQVTVERGKLAAKNLDTRMLGDHRNDLNCILQAGKILSEAQMQGIDLYMPYLPNGRQDRETETGTCFTLDLFANVLQKSGYFRSFKTIDPHSAVAEKCFNRLDVMNQPWEELVEMPLEYYEPDYILLPDKGAALKYPQLLQQTKLKGIPTLYATKVRDPSTGQILETTVPDECRVKGTKLLIIDDICDGGRTFIEIAKAAPEAQKQLVVTHGIFSKGIEVLTPYFDMVYTTDSFDQVPTPQLMVLKV